MLCAVVLAGMYATLVWVSSLDIGEAIRWILLGAVFFLYGQGLYSAAMWVFECYRSTRFDIPNDVVSVLRESFDVLLPCTVDAAGHCWLPSAKAADVAKLEASLGWPVRGASLSDLVTNDEERQRLAAHVASMLDQVQASCGANAGGGVWQGLLPPAAQTLRCALSPYEGRAGAVAGQDGSGATVVHLTVVPLSALGPGRGCRAVAAVRLGGSAGREGLGEEAARTGAREHGSRLTRTSASFGEVPAPDGADTAAGSASGRATSAVRTVTSSARSPSSAGSSRSSRSEEASFMGDDMRADVYLVALARAARTECDINGALHGSWTGVVGGSGGDAYVQTMRFREDGVTVEIDLLGVTIHGVYRLSCIREPYRLEIHWRPRRHAASLAPPVRYIFQLQGDRLTLGGPVGEESGRLPRRFEGPDLCVLHRAAVVTGGGAGEAAVPAEPRNGGQLDEPAEPEAEADIFSRRATEEPEAESFGESDSEAPEEERPEEQEAGPAEPANVVPEAQDSQLRVHAAHVAVSIALAVSVVCLLSRSRAKP